METLLIVILVLFFIAIFYAMLFFAWWMEQPKNWKVKQVVEGYFHLRFLSEAAGELGRSSANGEWWKAAAYAVMLPFLLMFALCFLVVDVIGLKKAKEKLERFNLRLARRFRSVRSRDISNGCRDASAKQSTNEGVGGKNKEPGPRFHE